MSIEHVLPSLLNDGLSEEPIKIDATVTRFQTGGRMVRYWTDEMLKAYRAKLLPLAFGDGDIAELKAFQQHILGVVHPFWVIEPWSETHQMLLCGAPGDGSLTTFVLPVYSYSALLSVYWDDVFKGTTTYTAYTAANLVANDNDASAAESVGAVVKQGAAGTTVARFTGHSADGQACFRVNQAASANNGLALSGLAVTGGVEYTAHAYVRGTGTYFVRIVENDGSTTTTDGSTVTGSGSQWKQVSVTKDMEAGTTALTIQVLRAEATAATFFVDCIGLSPGDSARWWLPSKCPGLLKFTTAPGVGVRVKASATGKRMSYVACDKSGIGWMREQTGHIVPDTIDMLEVLETT